MKFQLVSDLHLDHEFNYKSGLFVPEAITDTLVIAGDTWVAGKEFTYGWIEEVTNRFKNVVMVAGNHDFYGTDHVTQKRLFNKLASSYKNLHFLENNFCIIDDVKFVGCTLWTDFMYKDYEFYADERRFRDWYKLSDSSVIFHNGKTITAERILELHLHSIQFLHDTIDNNSIVVTHHNPSYKGLHKRWKGRDNINHLFFSDLEYLIDGKQPKAWCAGHTHDPYDFHIGKTRIVCNPRGYVSAYGIENELFDPLKVIEV